MLWEAVSDGGAGVGELADSIKFIVVDLHGASVSCPRTFVFFRLMVRSKSCQILVCTLPSGLLNLASGGSDNMQFLSLGECLYSII